MEEFVDDRQLLILIIKLLKFFFMIRIKLIGEVLLSAWEYFLLISWVKDSTT